MDTASFEAMDCGQRCPELARATLDVVGAKWAGPIYMALRLADRPVRYADLLKALAPITPKELAKQVKHLQLHGIVERRVHPTNPPSVDYTITTAGRDLDSVFVSLSTWSLRQGGQHFSVASTIGS